MINLIKANEFNIQVDQKDLNFKAKATITSYSYSDKSSKTTFSWTFKEIDRDEEKKLTFTERTMMEAIQNRAKIRALVNLLEDKDIIKESEYKKEYYLVLEKNLPQYVKDITGEEIDLEKLMEEESE